MVMGLALLGAFPSLHAAPLRWGLYQEVWGERSYGEELEKAMLPFAARPEYVMFFRDLRRSAPKAIIASHPDLTFIVSLELHEWRHRDGEYLDRIHRGEYDGYFRTWARDAASTGRPVWLRFGFEMSGKWFGWSGRPEAYRQAWIRVHDIFVREKAANVKWMFSPNVLYGSQTFEKDILPYYPGDGYVDMVGLDGYNFGDRHDRYHRWESYAEVFEPSLKAMQRFRKPLWISEIGCADDPRKSAWMKDFLESAGKDPRVSGFVYFNYDKRSEGEPNWALDSDGQTLDVFRKWLKR